MSRTKKSLLACLSAVIAVSLSVAAVIAFASEPDGLNGLPDGIETGVTNELPVGTTLELGGAYIVTDGAKLQTYVETSMPDGRVNASKTLELDTMGVYEIAFYAYTAAGEYTEHVLDVYAYNETFSFDDEISSSQYGEHKNAAGVFGEVVSLYEGATATYGKVIDLNGYDVNDVVFEWLPVASTVGAGDFTYVEFTFTDLYDDSNYFKVSGNYHHTYKETYFKAAAPDQILTGWYSTGGWANVGNEYGSNAMVSFYNTPRWGGSIEKDSMKLKFDSKAKAVHVGDVFVIDFDDPKYFSNLWDGFTTGECILSMTCGGYVSDKPAQFMFREIAGEKLDGTPIRDTDAPKITVDYGVYSKDTMPTAKLGSSYPVPEATVWDTFNGVLNAEVSVWLNYGNSAASQVEIVNGRFTPTRAATYTIVYEAKDYSGNAAVVTVPIYSSNQMKNVTVALKNDAPASWLLGEVLSVHGYTVTGGTGEYSVAVSVTAPDGTETALSDGENYILTQKGQYKVTYIATDFIGSVGYNAYQFEVTAAGVPVFYDDAALPDYFIAGVTYTLPALAAFDYASGTAQAADVKVRVTDGGGTRVLEGLEYVPSGDTGDVVTVVYFAANKTGEGSTAAVSIPVVKTGTPNQLDTAAYFAGTAKAALTANGEKMIVTAKNTGDTVKYILPVIADGFTVDMKPYGVGSTLSSLTLTLKDAENPDIGFDATLVKTDIGSNLIVGGMTYAVSASLVSSRMILNYSAANNQLALGDTSYPVNGFGGFPSGKAYVTLTFGELSGDYNLEIMSVNSQVFNTTVDEIKPKFSVLGEFGGIKELGSTVTVYKAAVADMFDPCVTAYVTVTGADGKIMTAEDGTVLNKADIGKEYRIRLDSYGYYRVAYYTEDWNENFDRNFGYQFIVEDVVRPEISVSTKDLKGSVGKSVKLPTATATDNYTAAENLKISVFVMQPDGYLVRVKTEGANAYQYTPQAAGKYTVRYYCMDERGNGAIVEVVLTVS